LAPSLAASPLRLVDEFVTAADHFQNERRAGIAPPRLNHVALPTTLGVM